MVESCSQCLVLQQRIRELEIQVQALTRQIAHLTKLLEEAQRAGKRQAAPFAKGPPKEHPKTPGRKAGEQHGRHGHRPPPAANDTIHECWEATLPPCCPYCCGPLEDTGVDFQYQTEIPRQPIRRRFTIHRGRCRQCGRHVHGRHPLQTSDATGAAASQVGPDAQAAVVLLNKRFGLSHVKTAQVMTELCGVPLTRGAVTQIVLRAGRRLRPAYQEILRQLPEQPWVSPDETGWRVGGKPAWLHVWVSGRLTCYAIDPHRSADALEKHLGLDYDGFLVHDGWASYDRFEAAIHQQCVAHVLRRAWELEERATGRATVFPRQVIDLFQRTLAVRDQGRAGQLSQEDLNTAYEHSVDELFDLTERPRANPANDTLARHLRGHAAEWFVFLLDPQVPATNWPAEQATRPAVVNRKVWGGNRNDPGAEAQSILMSVIATCRQHTVDALSYLSQSLRGFVSSLFASVSPATSPAGR
jgi:transposase